MSKAVISDGPEPLFQQQLKAIVCWSLRTWHRAFFVSFQELRSQGHVSPGQTVLSGDVPCPLLWDLRLNHMHSSLKPILAGVASANQHQSVLLPQGLSKWYSGMTNLFAAYTWTGGQSMTLQSAKLFSLQELPGLALKHPPLAYSWHVVFALLGCVCL